MEALKLQSSWKETREKIKEADNRLTDEDLVYDEQHPEQMIRHLAKKLRRDESYVKDWVESVSANKPKAS